MKWIPAVPYPLFQHEQKILKRNAKVAVRRGSTVQ